MNQRKWTVVLLYPIAYTDGQAEAYVGYVEAETWLGADRKARLDAAKTDFLEGVEGVFHLFKTIAVFPGYQESEV
jgi:hypothetical protein